MGLGSSRPGYPLVILTALLLLLGGLVSAATPAPHAQTPQPTDASTTVYLLRNENYLVLHASDDIGICHVSYVFPPDYQYQVPVMLEILPDTTATILSYTIVNDTQEPNKLVTFTLADLHANQTVLIHFNSWVLLNNHVFSDLPSYVRFPALWDLPTETWQWLSPSHVVQSHSLPILLKAFELRRGSTNLLRYAQRVMFFVAHHRQLFYILQYDLGTLKSQDAKTVLRRSGDCPGRAHLASALFRAEGVPARSIMVSQHNTYWVQMHYMLEYYCPCYGWILCQTHSGKTPFEQKNDVILRICSPSDEAYTVHDYIFPQMTGEEPWIWIDSSHLTPVYTDAMDASRQNMFPEGNHTMDPATAAYAHSLTQLVFRMYQTLLGENLTGTNLEHYTNATTAQHEALVAFNGPDGLTAYLTAMNQAYQEYLLIH